MLHFPLNHPAAPFYRVAAGVVAILLAVWGFVALGGGNLVGLTGSTGLAVLLFAAAVLVAAGLLLGRRGHTVYLVAGAGIVLIGLAGLATLRVGDPLGLNVSGCIVLYLAGIVVALAGAYTKTGSRSLQAQEEEYRHHSYGRVAEVAKELSAATPESSKRAHDPQR